MQPPALFPVLPDARLPRIHERLLARYGRPALRELWDPLKQFIYSMLSSRTKPPNSHQVIGDLLARFGTWEGVRDAPVLDIEQTLQIITFPEVKAPRLKAALQQITARCGSLSLDLLAKYRREKIRQWLESYEGVGPKTSASVVNFSTLRRRALCVDSHHLRVSQRLALTPRADAATTEERLMRLVPATGTPSRDVMESIAQPTSASSPLEPCQLKPAGKRGPSSCFPQMPTFRVGQFGRLNQCRSRGEQVE